MNTSPTRQRFDRSNGDLRYIRSTGRRRNLVGADLKPVKLHRLCTLS